MFFLRIEPSLSISHLILPRSIRSVTFFLVTGKSVRNQNSFRFERGYYMLAAIKGYYDGKQIVVDEDERENLNAGDEVIITILNKLKIQKVETRVEKRRRLIESDAFVIPSGRTAKEIDDYIGEMRDNERF